MELAARSETWDWRALERSCRREVRRILRGAEGVDDVVQEAMARAWRFRGSCTTPAEPTAWCVAIARNEALRFLRNRAARGAATSEALLQLADRRAMREIEGAPDRIDLARALDAGTAHERRLMLLRYGADLSTREVARLLTINETTARVQLHRARLGLRARLASPPATAENSRECVEP